MIKEGYFVGVNNHNIYYKSYVKESDKASVVIFHGFCESADKYDEIIEEFINNDMSVFIMDHRGNGRSGRLGADDSQISVDDYMHYIEDVKIFLDTIVAEDSVDKKKYLFAHSMGGGIGAYILEHEQKYFDKAVLSCPMMEIDLGNFPEFVVKIIANFYCAIGKGDRYLKGATPYREDYNIEASGTSSKERYDVYHKKQKKDKLLCTGGGSYRWIKEVLKITDIITKEENASKVEIPVLLFQAGNDTFVKPEGQNKFAKYAKNCELIRNENAKHEFYRERDEIYYPYIKKIIEFYNS